MSGALIAGGLLWGAGNIAQGVGSAQATRRTQEVVENETRRRRDRDARLAALVQANIEKFGADAITKDAAAAGDPAAAAATSDASRIADSFGRATSGSAAFTGAVTEGSRAEGDRAGSHGRALAKLRGFRTGVSRENRRMTDFGTDKALIHMAEADSAAVLPIEMQAAAMQGVVTRQVGQLASTAGQMLFQSGLTSGGKGGEGAPPASNMPTGTPSQQYQQLLNSGYTPQQAYNMVYGGTLMPAGASYNRVGPSATTSGGATLA